MKDFKFKRTLRRHVDDANRRYENAYLNYQDTQRKLDEAQNIAWDWKTQHDLLLGKLPNLRAETARADEAEKARDEAVALAAEYAAILEQKYGWAPPNDPEWADTPDTDHQPDAATEVAAPLWNDMTGMFGVVDLDAEPESFTTYITKLRSDQLPDEQIDAALKKPRRRVPAARKPAAGS
jgi:hypothetical protein